MMHGLARTGLMLGAALLLPIMLPTSHAAPARAAVGCNDVALVLAVDGSASVSAGEFLLEKRGISAAFRDPGVIEAIRRAGRVALSVVFWGADATPKVQSDWVIAEGADGAEGFARMIEAMPRQVTGDTGLGAGLATALARLTSPDICATRRIINLSGDGKETVAVRGKRRNAVPAEVRDMAQALEVEINALAISHEEPGLAAYYARNVITGPAAFVMDVRDYAGFTMALRRKLIREISPQSVATAPPRAGSLAGLN